MIRDSHGKFHDPSISWVKSTDCPGWSQLGSCGYGSIPMKNPIFNGMNIHKSQLFWCELQGYKVLTHCHVFLKSSKHGQAFWVTCLYSIYAKLDHMCRMSTVPLLPNLLHAFIVVATFRDMVWSNHHLGWWKCPYPMKQFRHFSKGQLYTASLPMPVDLFQCS